MESQVQHLLSRADSLAVMFKQGQGRKYIDQAVVLNREALVLCPPPHPKRVICLTRLSIHLLDRYNQHGAIMDVEEMIILGKEALALCPLGHQDRPMSLNNVALSIFTRYKRLGALDDLNEAIVFSKDTLALCPSQSLGRSMALINVATHLFTRYKRSGGMEDLNEAIVLSRDSLTMLPTRHPKRPVSLNNVAAYLFTRYRQLKAIDDLNEAIVLARRALALRPVGHLDRPVSLNNIALYHSTRYKCLRNMDDLDKAIVLGREALALRPAGHPDRSISLINVAGDLSARYKRLKEIDNLDEAIDLSQLALELRPAGHPDRSTSLNNLALHYFTRYKCLERFGDLDKAIDLGRDALPLLQPGHPLRLSSLANLAGYLHARFAQSGQPGDKEELFGLYSQIEPIPKTASSADLSAAKAWIYAAERFRHPTTLPAYETFFRLLTHHLTILPSLPQHLSLRKELTSSLAVDAFSACLRNRSPTTAVELLEQGRGIFWSQLTRLRSPLDDVIAFGPTGKMLADEFLQLASLIRSALDSEFPITDRHDRICSLTIELQTLIHNIRELPGLSRFLLPWQFSDLRQSASRGPVIIVNASEYSCDALVVLLDRDPVHIPLQITRGDVQRLSSNLHTWTLRAKTMSAATGLAVLLREIWDMIVSPIVNSLETKYPHQSRIWWCPTAEFSLLPLHAAGPYRKGQKGLADFYISSYTPTLAALIRARRDETSSYAAHSKRFVAIGQAEAMGESKLYSVDAELDNVARHVDGLAAFTRIEGPDACVARMAQELGKNQWIHLACHGLPDRKEPFKSAFALYDGHFTIEHIIQCELKDAQFAYLSACHTTVGDEKGPDEMIHLASAMQFAGFRSVIGTMWTVDDEQAVKVTSRFYKYMVGESGHLDHTRAAFALHKTMKEVKGIPFDQRVLYVHLGV